MTLDEALVRFEQAARAVEREHPSLRLIVDGARQSAARIKERFQIDQDSGRADRELATLLLDLGEAVEREAGVQRYFPPEHEGGPPSMATMERVRARARGSLGIAEYVGGVHGTRTLLGAELGSVVSAGAEHMVRSVAVRSGNRWIDRVTNWWIDVFGGPDFDVEFRQPVGTVTISPLGKGDPAKQVAVILTAFALVGATAYAICKLCCRCPRRAVA